MSVVRCPLLGGSKFIGSMIKSIGGKLDVRCRAFQRVRYFRGFTVITLGLIWPGYKARVTCSKEGNISLHVPQLASGGPPSVSLLSQYLEGRRQWLDRHSHPPSAQDHR